MYELKTLVEVKLAFTKPKLLSYFRERKHSTNLKTQLYVGGIETNENKNRFNN